MHESRLWQAVRNIFYARLTTAVNRLTAVLLRSGPTGTEGMISKSVVTLILLNDLLGRFLVFRKNRV